MVSDQRSRGPIVVGVDGSVSAAHAVRWAIAEAARRGVSLRLVHAHVEPLAIYPGLPQLSSEFDQALLDQAKQWLDEAAKTAREISPEVDVDTELATAGAVPVLLEQSRTAGLVVLGSRGLGGFTGLLIGSTAVALAAHGHAPMVVVRGRTVEQPPPETGPIAVGIDGSPAADAALGFAFDQAAGRGARLIAVHTWNPATGEGLFPPGLLMVDWDAIAVEERRSLAERLAPWQEKYPDVPVTTVVTRETPARSLLDQAATAQLVVVGSRGRGGFSGLLLGSTSQALLHHAPCPVAVVRAQSST